MGYITPLMPPCRNITARSRLDAEDNMAVVTAATGTKPAYASSQINEFSTAYSDL
jgi:pyrroline-5-carboxylate reductase